MTEINIAEYGDGRRTSSRDDLSAIAMRFVDEYLSLFAAQTIFGHIYFFHEKKRMASDASENAIFFHSTSPYVNNANRGGEHGIPTTTHRLGIKSWQGVSVTSRLKFEPK